MSNLFSRLLVLSLPLMLCLAPHGTLSVNPSPVMAPGTTATITYSDPSKAGVTIGVVVKGGYPVVEQLVSVTLDANGVGTGTWTAPSGWTAATFLASDANSVRVTIQ